MDMTKREIKVRLAELVNGINIFLHGPIEVDTKESKLEDMFLELDIELSYLFLEIEAGKREQTSLRRMLRDK